MTDFNDGSLKEVQDELMAVLRKHGAVLSGVDAMIRRGDDWLDLLWDLRWSSTPLPIEGPAPSYVWLVSRNGEVINVYGREPIVAELTEDANDGRLPSEPDLTITALESNGDTWARYEVGTDGFADDFLEWARHRVTP